ncbi:MAG: M1 family metallopeptidase [Sediminibacterium sp.]|nr:M1 family metallopeptidase [Sediminibacterium sp.]
MKHLFLGLSILCCLIHPPFSQTVLAQSKSEAVDSSWKQSYRAVATKTNNLKHTKLVASFNYQKSQMNGEVWLKLQPHFYPTNQLVLDAKAMDIKEVALMKGAVKSKLVYQYDSLQLHIDLDKTYTAKESYTIYIKYIARPNEFKGQGSEAIRDAKGMYFINPLGTDKDKPTQIWTQGETEASSVWIPTIDKTNQKTTQEFYLTVPSKYVSLSNGLLVKQTDLKNGFREDVWKMDLPHSPYLFFIGIGDYAVIKEEGAKATDGKRKVEVSYYIEKAYEKVAKKIYGNTPQMIAFFESKLGVPFPWSKYAQISGRDFVSGAMENTTATLHSDAVQQDARELVDGNNWESTIAHELFHQWFGDYVTAESWSNITVNESFADYSQTLWFEHSQGKDAGAYENYTALRSYLSSPTDAEKDLVRFFYKDKEDVFDLVSYQKGGRILNMLRHFVGDDAFFASLNKYLTDNKFSNGSAIKLKLAFEAVTGKDLNWFFNQWYFGNGHPYVRIQQKYLADQQKVLVTIQQTQTQDKIFTLPVGIDVYVQGNRNHYEVWSKNRVDSFYFPAAVAPDNVNVDNDKVLLWAKDESKPIQQYAYQMMHARNFMDRFEAANEAATNLKNPAAKAIIEAAIKDSFHIIRSIALNSYNPSAIDAAMEAQILELASKDKVSTVREDAINVLSKLNKANYLPYFEKWINDSSYTVAGAALAGLAQLDTVKALTYAKAFSTQTIKKRLNKEVASILIQYGDASVFDFIANAYSTLNIQSSEKFEMTAPFGKLLQQTTDPVKFKKGIDLIVEFREAIPQGYRVQTDPYFNFKILGDILKAKKQKGENELAAIVSAALPKM